MTDSTDRARILTLVFTDLADSTALKTERGDAAVDELLTRHRAHVSRIADECLGRVIDWAGDGCFLTFETSSAAVVFALRLQQTHAEVNELPGVRIGIHLGEVTDSKGPDGVPQVKGLAVDLAARISGLAKPGQVLMSATVFDSARQRLGIDAFGKPILWQAHGSYELKGFDKPVEINEAGLDGITTLEKPLGSEKAKPLTRPKRRMAKQTLVMDSFGERHRALILMGVAIAITVVMAFIVARSIGGDESQRNETAVVVLDAAPVITSIAVLPFENMSSDPEQEYFVAGMTEALIAELAKIKSIKVVSRTSAMRYGDSDLGMPEIARALNADALIEGSVLKAGNDVRITAQLIRGATDDHLWADSFDSTLENVLKLHSEVALAIAREVHAAITPQEAEQLTSANTISPEVLDLYLRGKFQSAKATEEGFARGIDLLRSATELAPDFAPAFAALSVELGNRSAWGYGDIQADAEEGLVAARTAVRLDPANTDARCALGWAVWVRDWNWREAEEEMLLAIGLDPESALAHSNYSWYLSFVGRPDEAVEEALITLRLDPLSLTAHFGAATAYSNAGRYDEAIDICERAGQLDPSFFPALLELGNAYVYNDQFEEAAAAFERALVASERGGFSLGGLGVAQARLGNTDAAYALADELVSKRDNNASPNKPLAYLYAHLGELDKAFETLERAFAAHEWVVTDLSVSPIWDPLRDDSRFDAFAERLNLPEN